MPFFLALVRVVEQFLSRSSDIPVSVVCFFFPLQIHSTFASAPLQDLEVPAPAQPWSKSHKPVGSAAKRSSLCTKNGDPVCWLTHSLQQLGPRACAMCQAGAHWDSSWRGSPPARQLLFPLWVLQRGGEGLLLCSPLLCCRGNAAGSHGARCH